MESNLDNENVKQKPNKIEHQKIKVLLFVVDIFRTKENTIGVFIKHSTSNNDNGNNS